MTAEELSKLLLEHPKAEVFKLGGCITNDKVIWNGRNFYID